MHQCRLGPRHRRLNALSRQTSHASEDICTLPGMLMAAFSLLRVKENGAFWSSPESRTWLNMSMYHTRWTRDTNGCVAIEC
eukprot:9467655-Pyramimonas_sp.AAC.1